MNEFVRLDDREVLLGNPSREQAPIYRRLRTFPPKTIFLYATDDYGDEYIHSIDGIRMQYQTMELARNITYWRFADGTGAYSYLVDSHNDKTRRFVSEPWELRSCIRELNLKTY